MNGVEGAVDNEKNVLISEQTSYQHVDVVEWHYPPRRGSLSDNGRGMSHPENKVLHLDGVEQSSLYHNQVRFPRGGDPHDFLQR